MKIPGVDSDKVCILDDDLVFSKRDRSGVGDRIITVKSSESDRLTEDFNLMEEMLDRYPLVGVHPRQMGQNTDRYKRWVENGRIICVQGINRKLVGEVKVDQFPILADVVLNLTILARGQKNALLTTFFQDHGPCQAPGGCSIYRTPAMQEGAVRYLCDRFPEHVKHVTRKPKVAKWMGDERHEYTAQWKKLHAAGAAFSAGLRDSPDREVSQASRDSNLQQDVPK